MPADPRGHVRKLLSGKWQLRYYDREGSRRSGGAFPSKSAALNHYRDVIEPELDGRTPRPEITFAELVDLYLERHALVRSDRTIRTLRARLRRPVKDYGETKLRELETMGAELAKWRSTLPPAFAYQVMSAMRQIFAAGVRWRYLAANPAVDAGANPKPKPRGVRVLTVAEVDALEVELGLKYGPIVAFAAATGLRPSEWVTLERRDIDRQARVVTVRGTKTARSRREVPLSARAIAALDRVPPRLDTQLVFPAPRGGSIVLDRFRKREWAPAVEAAGVAKPCRIYDLRSTFASNALAAGVTVFELARIMGTSVSMIEHHYGALIDGAHAGIVGRLDVIEAALAEAAKEASSDV
jgi:integrase